MARYIDADILPKLFDEEYKKTRKLIEDGETHLNNLAEGFSEAARVVTFVSLTATDVQEVRHGRWIDKGEYAVCMECGGRSSTQYNGVEPIPLMTQFCPHCGAKMDGDEK